MTYDWLYHIYIAKVAKSDKPPTLDGWNLKKTWDVYHLSIRGFRNHSPYVAICCCFFSERPSFWSISWWLAYRLPQQFSQICRCFIGTSKDRNVNYHYFCNFSRNLLFYCLWICIYIYFSIPSQDVLWSKTHVEMKPSSKRGVPIWMVSNIKFCTVMALNSCKWTCKS